jgi:hypothetical protein
LDADGQDAERAEERNLAEKKIAFKYFEANCKNNDKFINLCTREFNPWNFIGTFLGARGYF